MVGTTGSSLKTMVQRSTVHHQVAWGIMGARTIFRDWGLNTSIVVSHRVACFLNLVVLRVFCWFIDFSGLGNRIIIVLVWVIHGWHMTCAYFVISGVLRNNRRISRRLTRATSALLIDFWHGKCVIRCHVVLGLYHCGAVTIVPIHYVHDGVVLRTLRPNHTLSLDCDWLLIWLVVNIGSLLSIWSKKVLILIGSAKVQYGTRLS